MSLTQEVLLWVGGAALLVAMVCTAILHCYYRPRHRRFAVELNRVQTEVGWPRMTDRRPESISHPVIMHKEGTLE